MNDETCSICLDPLSISMCINLACNHIYHSNCFYNYLYFKVTKESGTKFTKLKQFNCPVCRQLNIHALSKMTKNIILENDREMINLKQLLVKNKNKHTKKKWAFMFSSLLRKPTKIEIFEYLQTEDKISEQIDELKTTIKAIQRQNEITQVVSQFIQKCVRCL